MLSGSDVGVSERQEEFKELEEQKCKRSFGARTKKQHMLIKWEGEGKERYFFTKIGRIESDKTLDTLSFEPCSSSMWKK